MSKIIISEIERKHISSLHNLFLIEQTVEKVKVFKDKGGTYQYAKLPNGTYWYKAGSGAWTEQTKQKGKDAIEKRIKSDSVEPQPDLEITQIDKGYKVEVKKDENKDKVETKPTGTTTNNVTKTTGDTSTGTTGTTGTTSSDISGEGGKDEGGKDEGGDGKGISAVRGQDDDPVPQFNTAMAEKYPKNPLAKYTGYFKNVKLI